MVWGVSGSDKRQTHPIFYPFGGSNPQSRDYLMMRDWFGHICAVKYLYGATNLDWLQTQ
jgi:hypothetical protein